MRDAASTLQDAISAVSHVSGRRLVTWGRTLNQLIPLMTVLEKLYIYMTMSYGTGTYSDNE